MAEKLKVTLVKSPIGAIPKHRATVEALGLTKMHKTVELPNNDAVKGMVAAGYTSCKSRRSIRIIEIRRCHHGFIKFKTCCRQSNTAITSEEDADMVQETARLPVRDIKDRRHVQAHREPDSRVARCRCTDVFRREVSRTEILLISKQSIVSALEVFENDAEVTVETLLEKGIIKRCQGWR